MLQTRGRRGLCTDDAVTLGLDKAMTRLLQCNRPVSMEAVAGRPVLADKARRIVTASTRDARAKRFRNGPCNGYSAASPAPSFFARDLSPAVWDKQPSRWPQEKTSRQPLLDGCHCVALVSRQVSQTRRSRRQWRHRAVGPLS